MTMAGGAEHLDAAPRQRDRDMIRAAFVFFVVCLHACGNVSPSAAQDKAAETAYVESVTGRVVALVQGKPVLLDLLDTIADQTRLDLLANSELRICHYQKQKIVILAGPLRASISVSGVKAENGKEIAASTETCVKPVESTFQGGFIARTAGTVPMNVGLRPNIKIVNRTANGIRNIVLWDDTQQKVVTTFKHTTAQPVLTDGQVYHLVVGRNDGSESKMVLRASATAGTSPLILVVP
jgi:hypothetical protein